MSRTDRKHDRHFGENVARHRKALGMAQNALMVKMRAAGYDAWYQTTVVRTETGERPVLLDEAIQLAIILDVGLYDLMSPVTAPLTSRFLHYSEANLARHVRWQRQLRGLSQEALAGLMTAAGCPMHQSSIAKIERDGGDRRAITVNELLAFAQVFQLPVMDLLRSPESIVDDRTRELEERVQRCGEEYERAQAALQAAVAEIDRHHASLGIGGAS